MDGVSLLRELFREAYQFLEGTMQDVTAEQAGWSPPGKAMPIAAQYAHIVMSADIGVNGLLRQRAPLAADSWAGKSGVSELPPMGLNAPLDQWAQRVRIDLAALRQYAQAVYGDCEAYLASLTDDDLNRPVDLSAAGFGQQPVVFILSNGLIANVHLHCGEISCLKGQLGLRGYPG